MKKLALLIPILILTQISICQVEFYAGSQNSTNIYYPKQLVAVFGFDDLDISVGYSPFNHFRTELHIYRANSKFEIVPSFGVYKTWFFNKKKDFNTYEDAFVFAADIGYKNSYIERYKQFSLRNHTAYINGSMMLQYKAIALDVSSDINIAYTPKIKVTGDHFYNYQYLESNPKIYSFLNIKLLLKRQFFGIFLKYKHPIKSPPQNYEESYTYAGIEINLSALTNPKSKIKRI